jgi:hypothetical protein
MGARLSIADLPGPSRFPGIGNAVQLRPRSLHLAIVGRGDVVANAKRSGGAERQVPGWADARSAARSSAARTSASVPSTASSCPGQTVIAPSAASLRTLAIDCS